MKGTEIFKNENILFDEDNINGIDCSIGYIKKFKWSWIATQLNTFIFIGKTTEPINKNTIESYSESCLKYALKNNKGWPRGLQSGVVSIAILYGENIEKDAILFCTQFSKKHWSAMEIPVIYDSKNHQAIRFTNSPIWGHIYFPYIIKTIDRVIQNLAD